MESLRALPLAIQLDEITRITERDLDSGYIAEEVQLLRIGTFKHPNTGKLINVTSEMLSSMVKNFSEKVRGIDISIDYRHDSEDIAAAWILQLSTRNHGTELWAKPDWTPRGLKKLAEKEFRYLSAEFVEDYQDNETLEFHGPTLLGAGLTNRPVVKRMEPAVQLSEISSNKNGLKSNSKGAQMSKENEKEKENDVKIDFGSKELVTIKFDEHEQSAFQEMTPEQMVAKIKELEAMIAKLKGENDSMSEKKELAEKENSFNKMLAEGKVCEAQRESYVAGDMVKFSENAKPLNLKEDGNGGNPPKGDSKYDDAQDEVLALSEVKMKENPNLTDGESISQVLSENPKLHERYREETDV